MKDIDDLTDEEYQEFRATDIANLSAMLAQMPEPTTEEDERQLWDVATDWLDHAGWTDDEITLYEEAIGQAIRRSF